MIIHSLYRDYEASFTSNYVDELKGLAHSYVVIDRHVYDLYSEKLAPLFRENRVFLLDVMEENKTIEKALEIVDELVKLPTKRNTVLIAIGGGITQDVCCFVASVLYRGIEWYFVPISEVDFCAVVGNLLDNAIEGACRIADTHSQRWIHLGFFRIWDTFTIRCENSMAPKTVKRHKEGFFTAKESETGCHGFGIRNIELIAKAADGFCSFETVENTFIANITLPYPIREEPGTCSK